MARKLATAHGLAAGDVIVAREALDDLQSRLYCLQAALEDVDRDLGLVIGAGRCGRRPAVVARQRSTSGRGLDRASYGRSALNIVT